MSIEVNNRLMTLSPSARELLVASSTAVDLPLRTVLYEAEQPMTYAYFMTSGIASIVTAMPDGGTAEVGLIGNEGLVGTFHLLGPAPVSTDCFIQLEGTALRIPFRQLQKAF